MTTQFHHKGEQKLPVRTRLLLKETMTSTTTNWLSQTSSETTLAFLNCSKRDSIQEDVQLLLSIHAVCPTQIPKLSLRKTEVEHSIKVELYVQALKYMPPCRRQTSSRPSRLCTHCT